MRKLAVASLCVLCVQGALGCGSSGSDPIFGGGAGKGGTSGGSGGAGGKAGTAGSAGKATATGGASGSSGSTGAGAPGTGGTGGDGGSGGSSGTGEAGDAGTSGTGGSGGNGGAAGSGGTSGEGGGSGDGGDCTPVHPNVNGQERTCNAGFCYCSENDGCFEAAAASSCCVLPVVCESGSMDPVATINHPGDGEMRAANDPIPFVGVAADPQDGALTGAALVWTSSILSNPIGTGLTFDATLPVGTHVITLTAMDSDSNIGTDSITLTIE
jgi:hypothetical protein